MKALIMALLLGVNAWGQNELDGQWSLDLPNHEAGWLSVEKDRVELLWAVGAARPVGKFTRKGDALTFEKAIKRPLAPKDEAATRHLITLKAQGDALTATMHPVEAKEPVSPIEFSGKAIEIGFDPKFIADMLKVLEPDAPITLQLTDEKVPAVFTQEPNYTYVVVPLVGAPK